MMMLTAGKTSGQTFLFTQQPLLQRAAVFCGNLPQATFTSKYRKMHGLYSYKLTKNNRYKNPHAIPLHLRQQYE